MAAKFLLLLLNIIYFNVSFAQVDPAEMYNVQHYNETITWCSSSGISTDICRTKLVRLSNPFPFGNVAYNSLYMLRHGVIVFSNSNTDDFEKIGYSEAYCSPSGIPFPAVMPFFKSSDLPWWESHFGDYKYREVTNANNPEDAAIFSRITKDIGLANFWNLDQPVNWAFIATWRNLVPGGLLGKYTLCSTHEPTNSFQVVLASNGVSSFAIYQYGDMNWFTDPVPGVCVQQADARCCGNIAYDGNVLPQVGFSFGPHQSTFTFADSCTTSVNQAVMNFSNVGKAGKWVFCVAGCAQKAPEPSQPCDYSCGCTCSCKVNSECSRSRI